MDYPKSVPGVGLVNGKFADEDATAGQVGSLIPAAWGNGITDELINVLTAAGLVPSEAQVNQLAQAIPLIVPGRLLRTTVYSRVGGVQMVSVDGAAPTAVGAGSFVPLAEARLWKVRVIGAGASGGSCPATGANQASSASGGSGGSEGVSIFTAGVAGAIAITVGLGGAAPAAGTNNGNPGGSSSFGALLTSPGGTAGRGGDAGIPPGLNPNTVVPAAPSGANLYGCTGAPGGTGFSTAATAAISGAGGSGMGGYGGGAPAAGAGVAGSSPGAGGSGASRQQSLAAVAGGKGADGIVIVEEYR